MIASKLKLKHIHSKQLQESRFETVLGCGMKLIVAPRPGFTKKIAFVVADYGSTDSTWKHDGKRVTVPDGIAHFLEHQVFKKARADLSDVFTARGAYVNAHTSHTQTAYYFECTENFDDNLDTLLEMALTPYFDKKRPIHELRKEAGSLVAAEYGIFEASRFLRHSDIRITSQVYLDKKRRVTPSLSLTAKS